MGTSVNNRVSTNGIRGSLGIKGLYFAIFAIAILATLGFGSTGAIDSFTARPDGDGITLEWKSLTETGIKNYTIERSDLSLNNFQEVGNIAATGGFSYYNFHDGNLNAAPLAGQSGGMKPMADAYKYRLRMNLSDGELSYSETVNVTKPSSGVRRTWGMIKEMFH
jgi:hypothetical protein